MKELHRPTLIFLHGFLGSAQDWSKVIQQLSGQYNCISLDLPYHGARRQENTHQHFSPVLSSMMSSSMLQHTPFTMACVLDDLAQSLANIHQPFWLVGYSLGARLAMQLAIRLHQTDWAQNRLQGLILESGHFGLPFEARAARWHQDQVWARRFEQEPMCDVLRNWYQQSVFSSLNDAQKQSFVEMRSDNVGKNVATILRATSLAKQEILIDQVRQLPIDVFYCCGQLDPKYCAIAQESGLHYQIVAEAGHNIHVEQPKRMAYFIDRFIQAQSISFQAMPQSQSL